MNLALYVHDFRLEIGHSNSLIELVRHLPKEFLDEFDTIEVVSCRATPLEILFPGFKGKLRLVKIPIDKVEPSILKSVLFQIISYIFNTFYQKKNTYRIGIGICCLDVDAVSIQFIHHQWTKEGLALERKYPLRFLYKKLLFFYYEVCEKYLFSKMNVLFFSPAVFLTEYLKKNFKSIDAHTIYSGINLDRFNVSNISKREMLKELISVYPVLKTIDINKPIYLFVGAYERKGLEKAMQMLSTQNGAQFIVVGSPSAGRTIKWPENINIYPIHFSKMIEKFYTLADVFIFPTHYEPFGLVIFEAMAMGLTIITNEKNVGASELLRNMEEVYFCDNEIFKMPDVKPKSIDEKKALRAIRIKQLGTVAWSEAGGQLSKLIRSKIKHSS